MFPDLFSVQGKTALVTGGSSGIGYMIAEGLVRAGAHVYISSRKAEACAAAEKELSQYGEVTALPADVSAQENGRALIREIADRESGRLHILVNNAGATWGAPFDEFPAKGWDKVLDLNVKAPFFLAQAARPLLEAASVEDDPSRIINIGSVDGIVVPGFGNFSYAASKAAIHHVTRHLAAELSPKILVNAIAPGPFPTKMMEAPLQEIGDKLIAKSPVKRLGRPEDAAGAVVFLSSRASNYITGAVLPLDGGLSTTIAIDLEGV
ncbi:SDR family oxidoreductase [Catenulispora rubra]|uniref:SDR family oxidoreductase n=1 Tax=Catenulispora rubra TaxID=280293 RepID=UPI001892414F|nr:SDR family oxidoreductase [Catenulispora rubra]